MAEKIMQLIDVNTSKMKCKVCGYEHFAAVKPNSNGRYYKGSWQCANKCKI